MYREIITPKEKNYLIKIPIEYLNKQLEILVLPIDNNVNDEKQNTATDIINKTAGMFSSKKIDPIKWQNDIRAEWNN